MERDRLVANSQSGISFSLGPSGFRYFLVAAKADTWLGSFPFLYYFNKFVLTEKLIDVEPDLSFSEGLSSVFCFCSAGKKKMELAQAMAFTARSELFQISKRALV